jgi:hypothetical protein
MKSQKSKAAGLQKRAGELVDDLDEAIGERDQSNKKSDERIARYRQLSSTADYGDRELPEYDVDLWLEQALNENVRGLRDRSDFTLARFDPFQDVYTWKKGNYQQSDWYCFQEAVKNHQNTAWDILSRKNLKGLELPAL